MNRGQFSHDDFWFLLYMPLFFYLAAKLMWDVACELTSFLWFWGVFK